MSHRCSWHTPVRPLVCPIIGGAEGAHDGEIVDDEAVNPKHVLLGEPIVGTKVVTYDASGPGAVKPKLLPTPKGMTAAEWAEHCVTHVKFHDGCPFLQGVPQPQPSAREIT